MCQVVGPTELNQGRLGSVSAYIQPAGRNFGLLFDPLCASDSLNSVVFCSLALNTKGKLPKVGPYNPLFVLEKVMPVKHGPSICTFILIKDK